jgi:hypothetical protein
MVVIERHGLRPHLYANDTQVCGLGNPLETVSSHLSANSLVRKITRLRFKFFGWSDGMEANEDGWK